MGSALCKIIAFARDKFASAFCNCDGECVSALCVFDKFVNRGIDHHNFYSPFLLIIFVATCVAFRLCHAKPFSVLRVFFCVLVVEFLALVFKECDDFVRAIESHVVYDHEIVKRYRF